jgi:phage-related protein
LTLFAILRTMAKVGWDDELSNCMEALANHEDDPSMPETEVLLYCEDDGSAPLEEWLTSLQTKARARCLARLADLEEQGYELRRPHTETVGDGLYALRVKFYRVNFRMLYFFHGRVAAVVSHGFDKEDVIPPGEIKLALERMRKFVQDPHRHTFHPEE